MAHRSNARNKVIEWANALLRHDDWVILDVETSGLGRTAEIVQIGVLAPDGAVLLDQMLKPSRPIPAAAHAVHGISDADVADAPRFAEVYDKLLALLSAKRIIAYNADFDRRMIEQEHRRINHLIAPPPAHLWECAMLQYAAFYGDWNRNRGSFRWQKLTNACHQQNIPVADAHAAVGDCKLTLALIRAMANG